MTMKPLSICIFLCSRVALGVALDSFKYDLVPRRPRQLQQTWADIEDEAKISFDGNVAAIQQLALEKAAALADDANENNASPPVEELADPITCDGITLATQTVSTLWYEYIVEYDEDYTWQQPERKLQSDNSLDTIIIEIEKEVQTRLARLILSCQSDSKNSLEANIVGLVHNPRDKRKEQQSCVPENQNNSCADYEGRMTLFLADEEKEKLATSLALFHMKTAIEDPQIVSAVGRGLVKVTYAGREPIAPFDPNALGNNSNSSNMNGASIAVLTAGAATVLFFVGMMFAWRRKYTGDDLVLYDPASTVAQDRGSVHGKTSDSEEEDVSSAPSSPFSEMLPTAYRYSDGLSILSGQEGLSAVTEVTESEGSRSINISLSGCSEDAAANNSSHKVVGPLPDSFYSEILGARKRIAADYADNNNNATSHREISVGDDTSVSDVSGCPSDETEEHPSAKSSPTTSLLLGISSPHTMNASTHEDEALLFL